MNTRVKQFILYIFMATAIPILLASSPQDDYVPPHQKPGPASDTINFSAFDVGIASKELEAGSMDMYIYSLKIAAAEAIRDDPAIELYQAPASTISIVLNPAPALNGDLNPFSIKEVRQALQYILNRQFISQEIYKGFASPMLTHLSPTDFDSLTVFGMTKASRITYDRSLSKNMIDQAMTNAGATLKEGFWHFNGKRIDLKFIVRTEDERWEIGNEIRTNLISLGFSVTLVPQQFGPAIFTVYSTDPQLFQWHLYTEGWGKGSPQKYDFSSINHMCAPWLGNMPGWQEVGFWQYKSEQLDTIGQQIFTGDFSDIVERNKLYIDMTKECLEESVRLWVVTAVNNIPVSTQLSGVTQDITAGPKSYWTLREAYKPGGDLTLNVGNLWVWTNRTTWNPVGGFGDVYSNDIWNNIHDTPMATHPFTGLPIPFRADFEVKTEGPDSKLDVPGDAFLWDASVGQWTEVPKDTKATSKVTYDYKKYLQSTWHHGEPITMADVIYPIAQQFDIVYGEEKSNIEFSISTTSKPYTDTFRGFRIVDDSKLEVYVDFWHFMDEYIAQYANTSGVSMPWEILAAMDSLVFQQRTAAYSDTAAARFNVDPISLVLDKFARLVRNTIRDFSDNSYRPSNFFNIGSLSLVNNADMTSRYDASMNWFKETNHMVVSNGPFFLDSFDSSAQFASLKAFREPNYPFKPGDLYYGKPTMLTISDIEGAVLDPDRQSNITLSVDGPGDIGINYILQDPATGAFITSGSAESTGSREFRLTIPTSISKSLNQDLYHLHLAIHSDKLAAIVEKRIDMEFSYESGDSEIVAVESLDDASKVTAQSGVGSKDTTQSSPNINVIILIILSLAGAIGLGLAIISLRSRNRSG